MNSAVKPSLAAPATDPPAPAPVINRGRPLPPPPPKRSLVVGARACGHCGRSDVELRLTMARKPGSRVLYMLCPVCKTRQIFSRAETRNLLPDHLKKELLMLRPKNDPPPPPPKDDDGKRKDDPPPLADDDLEDFMRELDE
jgi:hypothetical protein